MSIYTRAFTQGVKRLVSLPRISLPVLITLSLTLSAVLTVVAMSSNLIFKPLPDIKDEATIFHFDKQMELSKDFKISIFNRQNSAEFANHYANMGDVASIHVTENTLTVNDQSLAISTITASNNFHTVITNLPLLLGDAPRLSNQDGSVWISESLWRNAFAKSHNVVGQSLAINDKQQTIRGVYADFHSYQSVGQKHKQQAWQFYDLNSHLADTPTADIGDVTKLFFKTNGPVLTEAMLNDFWQSYFKKYETELTTLPQMLATMNTSTKVELYRDHLMQDQNTLIMFLLISVSALLFMACLNLFNLFFSHYQQREQEFATQICFGSPRYRLALMAFVENLPLFLLSSIIGIFSCAWLIRALPVISGGNIEMLSLVTLDLTTVVISFFIVLLINALFSLSAMFQCNPKHLSLHISGANKGVNAGKMKPLSQALFITQLSAATIIMTGAAMLAQETYSKMAVDFGFEPGNTLLVEVELEHLDAPLPKELEALRAEMRRRNLALLEVKNQLAAAAQRVQPQLSILASQSEPFGKNFSVSMSFDKETNEQLSFMYKNIGVDYLSAFNLKLIAGRNLTIEEQTSFANVAIINEPLALQITKNGTINSAIGKQLGAYQIIGVIADHYSMVNNGVGYPTLMTPANHTVNSGLTMIMQLPEGQIFKQTELTAAMLKAYPQVKTIETTLLDDVWHEHIEEDRVRFYFICALCALTLLLAFIGTNAMAVGFSELKRFELAIRMATGASRKSLLKRTISAISPLLLAAFAVAIVLSTLLYWALLSLNTPLPSLSFTTLGLFGFALLAIVMSAITWVVWRIINADPMRALREL